jgi:pimeloyl-ACP methyl ester carboxylesterase
VFAAMPLRNRIGSVTNRWLPWPLERLIGFTTAWAIRQAPETRNEVLRRLHGDVSNLRIGEVPPLPPAVRDTITEPFRQGGRGYAWDGRLLAQRWRVPLDQIHVPVMLWHGDHDPFCPAVVGRYLAQTIPDCHATFYPDEKHYVLSAHEREILSTLAEVGRTTIR